jgi:hypothetical protein
MSGCLSKCQTVYHKVRLLITMSDCLSNCKTAYQYLLTTSSNL